MSPIAQKVTVLKWVDANPKAAGMRQGFFYEFSNYGTYERLTDDGLTQWYPVFLELGKTLDECAQKYRGFCRRYKPKKKLASKSRWASKLLAGINVAPRKKDK